MKPAVSKVLNPLEPPPPLTSSGRRRLFVRALAVGLVAGVLSVAFRFALAKADDLRDEVFALQPETVWGAVLAVTFSAVLVGLGVALVRRFAPEAAGSGIPHVEGVLHHNLPFRWVRVIVVKAVGGILAIGGGLALGREGPTVQMGAAVGKGIGEASGRDAEEVQSLIAVGAGAGLAASFNAPLAGMAFVFEELRGGFRAGDYLAALLSSAVADYLARQAFGQGPVFGSLPLSMPALTSLPLALLMGLLGGVLGVLFNRGVFATQSLFTRIPLRKWALATLFGAVVGLCGWYWPAIVGGGHSLLSSALRAPPVWGIALLLVVLRSVLTLGSYATGAAGGLFSPILVIGAYIGVACGGFVRDEEHANLAVILGMAGVFTGSIRAPVTGVLLMVEMTGSYIIILPLLATVLTAEFLAGEMGGKPLYAELLERNPAFQPRPAGVDPPRT